MFESSVRKAVECILNGGVVAFPTETYYGLAVDPYNESALLNLFKLKQRESEKAILVLIENSRKIDTVAANVPKEFKPLIEKFWPGPLTLIFPAKNTLSPLLTGKTKTVGVRVSPHPIAGALVRAMGKPVTATSANISGQKPAKSANEVKKIFGDRIDFIIDGGETAAGLCSTLVGLKNGVLTILREGQADLRTEL